MKELVNGLWGTVDLSLQRVGRSAACMFSRRGKSAEDAACAVLGGSLLCAAIGAVTGFALSVLSRHPVALSHGMATVEGAFIGLLLGACVGVFFGSFVEAVDQYIRNLLSTLSLK